ncbi:MAG: NfeD family protein [Bryobacterales bacterium]|nr:NfeD family protein [Bryobacterales bacterium]
MECPKILDWMVSKPELREFRHREMDWWIWALAGCALLALEMVSPGGFYVFFFGIGALAVGMLAALGIAETAWVQSILFTVVTVVSLLSFRRPILRRMRAHAPAGEVDTLVGASAVAQDEIGPGERGKAELRGSIWNARNAGQTAIARDQVCSVERVDGLTLWIRAD